MMMHGLANFKFMLSQPLNLLYRHIQGKQSRQCAVLRKILRTEIHLRLHGTEYITVNCNITIWNAFHEFIFRTYMKMILGY